MPKDDLPLVEGDGARARMVMGSLWGETSPVTCHSQTIYADIHLAAGGAMPIDAEADERGLYVAEGEASLDGRALEPAHALRAAPGHPRDPALGSGGHVMLLRRRAARRAAPRLLELRLLAPRPDQPGQGGLEGRPLRPAARRP